MKSVFLEKLIERLDRIDPKNLQTHFLRLAQERGLLETIFQSIQEGVIVLDVDACISYANRAAEELLGFNAETAKGRPISRYLREIDWKRILKLDAGEWSRLISREIEVRYPEHRFLNFYVVPLPAPSGEGAVVILRDVTRDRKAEATLLEGERLKTLQLLAAGVAHEIGNPLNALNIHLQLLDRELRSLPPDRAHSLRELVDIARNEVRRLDLIITQFLKAIRPSRPRLAPCRIETLLQETLTLLKPEMEDRKITVQLDLAADLPRIRADRHQIKQAFFNIIRNAFQAMSEGGRLTISVRALPRYAAVAFRDTGHGIAPEDLRRVWEPYYTTKPDGSGLGLMIVQRIVQDHGGQIELQSKPGEGTTVTLLLPLAEARTRLLKAPAQPPEAKELSDDRAQPSDHSDRGR